MVCTLEHQYLVKYYDKKLVTFPLLFTDEDKSGAIDLKELKHCFSKLEVNFTNEEISDLFKACDLNDDMGIDFHEFIVLLCLVYLLKEGDTAPNAVSNSTLYSN